MDRLGAIGSFLLIAVVVLFGLRGAHLLIGIAYPASLPGPFQLTSIDEVDEHADFQPHIPFYRPIALGSAPQEIVVERRPRPMTRIVWNGESSLELTEWAGGFRPAIDISAQPVPDNPQALYWQSGSDLLAVLPVADRWLQIRTSLDLTQLRRIIETLLPYDRLI